MEKPLYFIAPVALEAIGSSELPSRFSGVAYSGGKITDWDYPVIIDLASTKIADWMPLLYQHRHDAMIGTVAETRNDGASLTVSGSLFADIDDDAGQIARKASRGARYQMSVGLFGANYERIDSPDASVTLNGQTVNGPLVVLRDGMVREVSIVTLGADAQTNAAFFSALSSGAASPPTPPEEPPMPDQNPDLAGQVAALSAQIADLTTQLQAATARAESAESALAETQRQTRLAAVRDLFAAVGREFSDEAAAPYLGMPADVFAVVAADLKATRPAKTVPAHLFQERATGEPGQAPALLSASEIYAKRRVA